MAGLAGQVMQELQAGLARGVEVIKNHQQRGCLREQCQGGGDGLEQPSPLLVASLDVQPADLGLVPVMLRRYTARYFGQQAREIADQRAKALPKAIEDLGCQA